jgi:hypothetical protein
MTKFRVKQNVTRNLEKLKNLDVSRAMELGGIEAMNIISDRADKGLGTNGKLSKYTKKYADFKSKNGGSRKPNLQLSGSLLSSHRSVVNKKGTSWFAVVFFPSMIHPTAGIKMSRLANKLDEKRPFKGLNKLNEKKVKKLMISEIEKAYAKLKLS